MSNNRVKNVAYDDDDFYDDGYDSPDPEEQEALAQCTSAVLQQLRAGQPSVTATKEEIQEALWHYYNDIEKSVNYLRGKKEKEIAKQQSKAQNVPDFSSSAHFSAADFFRDCPWLNIPAHRKADILIEPLYPRLGLLGGAPENGGKVSKLAALAAARKKREIEKAAAAAPAELPITAQSEKSDISSPKLRSTPLSLRERLAANARPSKLSDESSTLRLGQLSLSEPSSALNVPPSEPVQAATVPESTEKAEENFKDTSELLEPAISMRASPSMFASAILGHEAGPRIAEPSHLDLLKIYGQDHAKPFDFAGPSPDDTVLRAQEKGFKSKPTASKVSGNKKAQADITNGMDNLSVEEKVTVKSKNLDVLAEFNKSNKKKAANFVVIGHVDAGKSTLMGRLLADQGAIDQRTLEKYRKEAEKIGKGSFALAWVLDQGSEERARGVTIDIATNKFETDTTAFTIVDAPGHRDFVPNMIAGASQADFAVLVIDASTGKFESGLKGQTKEHALLVRSMGVQKIVVAVNKMDTVQWNKGRFDEIEQHISSFLTTAGFQAKNIAFVPCSGVLGQNISKRYEDLTSLWYNGRTLIEELETSEPFTYALDKPLRMTIGDVFRGGVQNPISISGRLDAGSLQVGDQILTIPSGETALIRSLEVDSEPSDWAVAGQNVTLNLANIDPVHLHSGDVVCRASSPIAAIATFTAKVLAFEHLMPMMVDVHRGRLHVPGRISKLVASLDKASGASIKKRPKIVAPGTVVRVVVEMDQAVPLEAPTRIVLRSGGSTVAAGLLE
ncbi:Translation elongation/initiation factor/Ribosomal beta-barrel [Penicillium taxi]|uniref:Translation elongation/initiation factor/Ribosomal beta-barrel n=1 Tax=Penicillium taxi TaxID=168475 RepID=UPI0025453D91|nr:Translation elongation/initiation factor/Ribosomal beta-barrel [Penicillium taxi]KAJ5899588.1 Translation elongation/initiation factor/Ribosomal beta-barrel [Penicillium taxi]